MSTVEEHIARLQAMKPKEGGWLTREFQEGAAIFCGAHLDEIEAAWTATQQPDALGVLIDDAFEKMGQQPIHERLVPETGANHQDKVLSPDAGEYDTPACDACEGSGKITEAARLHGANQHSACQRDCDECDGAGRKQRNTDVSAETTEFRPTLSATQQPAGEGVNWKAEYEAVCAERIKDRERSQQIINERDSWIVDLIRERDAALSATQQPVCEGVGPTVAEQAIRHLSRLVRVYGDMLDGNGNTPTEIRHAERFLAALSATQQPVCEGVVVPRDLVGFLMGDRPYEGVWFNEAPLTSPGARPQPFWWRHALGKCIAATNPIGEEKPEGERP